MQALSTAKQLDWPGWWLGLWGALVSGGSSAVVAAFSVNIIDPKDWSPMYGGFAHLMELIAMCFCVSGVISLFKYLQMHPVPDVQVNEFKQVTTDPATGAVQTVKQKTEVSVVPGPQIPPQPPL